MINSKRPISQTLQTESGSMSSDEELKQRNTTAVRSRMPSTSTSTVLDSPPAPDSSLVFINTNKTALNGKLDLDSRLLIRRHVMSSSSRKKSSPQDEDDECSKKDVKPSQVGGQTNRFRLELNPQRRKGRRRQEKPSLAPGTCMGEGLEIATCSPQNLLGSPCIDPFSVAGLPWDSHMQTLVRYYAEDIPDSIHPLLLKYNMYHAQNSILKMAIADEALLHAILAYSMIHKFCFGTSAQPSDSEKVHFATTNVEALAHRTQAIHIINKKLGCGDICDSTIATVLILLWHHAWVSEFGDEEGVIHFEGMKQMVQCRGGLKALPEPLSKAIAFHDTKRSMLTNSKPQFPKGAGIPSCRSELSVPVRNGESVFARAPTLLAPILGPDLWEILVDLNSFTDFISYHRSSGSHFRSDTSQKFEHWNSSLEHRIFSYSLPNPGTNLSDDNFKEALRIAAALWMSTGLWHFPLSASLVANMARLLVDLLEKNDLSLWWQQFSDMLLWILVIGACCTPGKGVKRSFLLSFLKFIACERNLKGAYDFERELKRFIFLDGAYSASLTRLWIDMEEDKG